LGSLAAFLDFSYTHTPQKNQSDVSNISGSVKAVKKENNT